MRTIQTFLQKNEIKTNINAWLKLRVTVIAHFPMKIAPASACLEGIRAWASINPGGGGTSFFVLKLTWEADFWARFEFGFNKMFDNAVKTAAKVGKE